MHKSTVVQHDLGRSTELLFAAVVMGIMSSPAEVALPPVAWRAAGVRCENPLRLHRDS